MSQSNYITLALFTVIGLVFLIDFIKSNSKKSIDKSLEEYVKKEKFYNSWFNVDGFILILLIFISFSSVMMYIDPPDELPFFYNKSTGHLEAFRMFILKFLYIPIFLSIITYWYLRKIQSNVSSYFFNRKKNISLSLIIIPLLKVLTHFLLFPNLHEVVVDQIKVQNSKIVLRGFENHTLTYDTLVDKKEMQIMEFRHHFEVMFTERLDLFIPVTIVFLIVVWFFNDKIKAQ